jgi:hypothetical protein
MFHGYCTGIFTQLVNSEILKHESLSEYWQDTLTEYFEYSNMKG